MLRRITLLLLATFSVIALSRIPASAETISPSIYIAQAGSSKPQNELIVVPGDQLKLSVFADNFSGIGAVSGKLEFPLDNLSVAGIDQSFSVCSAWDEAPRYVNGEISFSCGQGEDAKAAGPIFTVTLVANKQFSVADLELKDVVGITNSGDYWRPTTAKLNIKAINYSQTSAEISSQIGTPAAIFVINAILIIAIIVSLVLAYRYLRLAKMSKFKD